MRETGKSQLRTSGNPIRIKTAIMETPELIISSNAFSHEGMIPEKYTCKGENINPPLQIENIPEAAVTLVLIMEDPDAPNGIFDHWLVWNIDPEPTIDEDSRPGINGRNSTGKTGYHGPCPPNGEHRYFFYVFALDIALDLPSGTDKKTLQQVISQHIIAQGHIIGKYG